MSFGSFFLGFLLILPFFFPLGIWIWAIVDAASGPRSSTHASQTDKDFPCIARTVSISFLTRLRSVPLVAIHKFQCHHHLNLASNTLDLNLARKHDQGPTEWPLHR